MEMHKANCPYRCVQFFFFIDCSGQEMGNPRHVRVCVRVRRRLLCWRTSPSVVNACQLSTARRLVTNNATSTKISYGKEPTGWRGCHAVGLRAKVEYIEKPSPRLARPSIPREIPIPSPLRPSVVQIRDCERQVPSCRRWDERWGALLRRREEISMQSAPPASSSSSSSTVAR
jgi:hypothetical protein